MCKECCALFNPVCSWQAYNVACFLALFTDRHEKVEGAWCVSCELCCQAREWLQTAIVRGIDIEHVSTDEDIAPLHGPEFDEVLVL